MKKIMRWAARVLAALVVLLVAAAAVIYFMSNRAMAKRYAAVPETLAVPTAAQLADAERLTHTQGCVNCHGEGLAGKEAIPVPAAVGQFWAPNLPLLARTVSDQQLATAIRQGIGHDGRSLFIMPSEQYSRLNNGQVAALIAYIRSLPVQGAQTPPLSWGPLGRIALAKGDVQPQPANVEAYRVNWPYQLGPEHAAGRTYTAQGCSGCHGADLAGKTMDNGIVTPDLAIVGSYELDQFKTLMRTGKAAGGRDLGLMSEAARKELSHMTDAEMEAAYAYLKARAEKVTK